ncbi:MAG: DEAD/DEAH box helicase family protein [Selenomonadaceae bacterium]|nr:DEAD/DEAH box helicase family protein [Selenomonadaceae bacterium]
MEEQLKNSLVINSAYKEPARHLEYDESQKTYRIKDGRRQAGYKFQAPSKGKKSIAAEYFVPLDRVNELRNLIKKWRESNYPGITPITRTLLEYWKRPDRSPKFFFCQLEAIETLIYLTEIQPDFKIPPDGLKHFQRLCTKLCTGGGKTIVMAMLIAYMACNKNRFASDTRFSSNILIVAPNLTVRERLLVLDTAEHKNSNDEKIRNYYEIFDIVPQELNFYFKPKILVINWQQLMEKNDKPAVDKRGAKSDEAYLRDIDGGNFVSKFRSASNLIVINDEAHHAWRNENPEQKSNLKGAEKKEFEEDARTATVWITGLDRIHRARNIRRCFDFSATPYIPSARKDDSAKLFGWIVSDFGLFDGIEAGIVKTPMLVYDSNGLKSTQKGSKYKSKLFHIYREEGVDKDLGDIKKSEDEDLPELVRDAYALLGASYQKSMEAFNDQKIPPVMITVASNTSATARIKYAFDHKQLPVPSELCNPETTLRIDSKIFSDESEEELREKSNTVGKPGEAGADIRNVISVGMLSEGWDAQNVTQIMGLRAFSSQLLCEQVLGRGLRRTSYELLDKEETFRAEFVNVFGIPINILPMDEFADGRPIPPPSKPAARIYPMPERKSDFEIIIPNVLRVDRIQFETLSIDWQKIPELTIQTSDIATRVDMGAVVDSEPDSQRLLKILYDRDRLQTIIFDSAGKIFDLTMKTDPRNWQKHYTKLHLIGQIVRLVQDFLESDKIKLDSDKVKIPREVLYAIRIENIIWHIWDYIVGEEGEYFVPMYNPQARAISTNDMMPWYTMRPHKPTKKSHISHIVADSSWEDTVAEMLDDNEHVISWVKNDHLGFSISYNFEGNPHRYIPDFVVTLDNGKHLVLEVKGVAIPEDQSKYSALEKWCAAVNKEEEFGTWNCAMSRTPQDVDGIIDSILQKNI